MRKFTFYFKIIIAVLFVTIYSCSKKNGTTEDISSAKDKEKTLQKTNLLAHIPMPAKLDSAMRQSFEKETYLELKKLNAKNSRIFYVTKENYLAMIDNFPQNADRVAFSFVQFNKNKFQNKYKDLSKFDGNLYMLYYYIDSMGKNVGGKTYAFLSVKNTLEISEKDYNVMFEDYKTNIKPSIDRFVKGPQGNTLYLKTPKDELSAYKTRMDNYKNIKKFKISLAQIVDFGNFLNQKQKSFLKDKLSQFDENNLGQMTYILDALDENGNTIEDLSGDDLQTPCPYDCN